MLQKSIIIESEIATKNLASRPQKKNKARMYFKGFDDAVTIVTYKYEYCIQKRCYKLSKDLETRKVIVLKSPANHGTRDSFSSIVKPFDLLTDLT